MTGERKSMAAGLKGSRLIEISYYKQKTFWSLCRYMLRNRKEIEILVNLINITMKLQLYQDKEFYQYRDNSVQKFRFLISGKIWQQIFSR